MCKWNATIPMPIHGKVRSIDSCIAKIVAALNAGGVHTKASCCGHRGRKNINMPIGSIILEDGRELIICPDFKTARRIDKYAKRYL